MYLPAVSSFVAQDHIHKIPETEGSYISLMGPVQRVVHKRKYPFWDHIVPTPDSIKGKSNTSQYIAAEMFTGPGQGHVSRTPKLEPPSLHKWETN